MPARAGIAPARAGPRSSRRAPPPAARAATCPAQPALRDVARRPRTRRGEPGSAPSRGPPARRRGRPKGARARARSRFRSRPPRGSAQVGLERQAQLLPRTRQPAHHGAHLDAERVGDLAVRQLLDDPEHQHRALIGRQRLERALEQLLRLALQHLSQGVSRGAGRLEVAFGKLLLAARLGGAEMVHGQVGGDLANPRPERPSEVEAVERLVCLEEGLLRDVVRHVVSLDDPAGDRVDPPLVAFHDLLESEQVPATGLPEKVRLDLVGPCGPGGQLRRFHIPTTLYTSKRLGIPYRIRTTTTVTSSLGSAPFMKRARSFRIFSPSSCAVPGWSSTSRIRRAVPYDSRPLWDSLIPSVWKTNRSPASRANPCSS